MGRIFGYKISQVELRLIPYMDYALKNERRLEPKKLTPEEEVVLSDWKARGFIYSGVTDNGRPNGDTLSVTKQFYLGMQEALWLGYVDFDNISAG